MPGPAARRIQRRCGDVSVREPQADDEDHRQCGGKDSSCEPAVVAHEGGQEPAHGTLRRRRHGISRLENICGSAEHDELHAAGDIVGQPGALERDPARPVPAARRPWCCV